MADLDYPAELRYSKTHEWVRIDEDAEITIGITHHAQNLLGELVFVELPKLHQQVTDGDEVAVLESVKTAADVYCPLAGEIIAINVDLQQDPSQVNHDPYGKGWLFKLKLTNLAQISRLLDAHSYQALLKVEIE